MLLNPNLPDDKLVFVYYCISLSLLVAYRGPIVLKLAKKIGVSGMVVWLECGCLKNKIGPPWLMFINY
jgi:hypothetical protein